MKGLKTAPATTEIPTISLRNDPEYARQADKLTELTNQEGVLKTRRSQLWNSLELAREAERDLLTRRAEVLLEDGTVPMPGALERAAMSRDIEAIDDELKVVARAIEIQRDKVQPHALRVSAEICRRVSPPYRASIARVKAAIHELHAANEETKALWQAIHEAGVIPHEITPMPYRGADLTDDYSTSSMWLREARELGLGD